MDFLNHLSEETEIPFPDFNRLIKIPLEKTDPKSFVRIQSLFSNNPAKNNYPFSFLIKKLCGKSLNEYKAKNHWEKIILHKKEMENKLGRLVIIQTAAIDYFSVIEDTVDYGSFLEESQNSQKSVQNTKNNEGWINKIYSPDYYTERLKDEILRTRRYKHALSTIMLDIDSLNSINEKHSYKKGDDSIEFIVRIIKKTVRMVDIIARYDGDRFLIILPNTNKREARELAERIRSNIEKRTEDSPAIPEKITVTLSVGQCGKNENSTQFAGKLENTLKNGKLQERNKVYEIN